MDSNRLDKVLRDKMDQEAKVELPVELSWDRLGPGITAQVDAERKKRRRILWLWLASLLALVVVTSSILFWQLKTSDTAKLSSADALDQIQIPSRSEASRIHLQEEEPMAIPQEDPSSADQVHAQDPSAESKVQSIDRASQPVTSVSDTETEVSQEAQNPQQTWQRRSVSDSNTDVETTVPKNTSTEVPMATNEIERSTNLQESRPFSGSENLDQEGASNRTGNTQPDNVSSTALIDLNDQDLRAAESAQPLSTIFHNIDVVASPVVLSNPIALEDLKVDDKVAFMRYSQLGLSSGLHYYRDQLSMPISDSRKFLELDESFDNIAGVNAELSYRHYLGPKLFVETGLVGSMSRYRFDHSSISEADTTLSNWLVELRTNNLTGDTEEVLGDTMTTYTFTSRYLQYSELYHLAIPMKIGAYVDLGRFQASLATGPQLMWVIGADGLSQGLDYSVMDASDRQDRGLKLAWLADVRLDYEISDHYSIFVSASGAKSISNVVSSQALSSQNRPLGLRSNLGIALKL